MRGAAGWVMGLVALYGCLERTTSGQVVFEDRAADSGLDLQRVPQEDDATLADRMMAGVCAIDWDGVAPLDLFFAGRHSGTGLFRALGNLRYQNASEELDLVDLDPFGCLAADLDGDGRDDLVVSGSGGVHLFRSSNAMARETLIEAPARWLYTSLAAGDLDGDGDLDLVAAAFIDAASPPSDECFGVPCGVALSGFTGLPNTLLLQEGGVFVDRTELAPDLRLPDLTLAVVIADLDGDGTPEILLGNDLGDRAPNRLLVREGEHYVDRGFERGLATNASGFGMDTMGLAIGDVDGSGTLDVAVSDFAGWTTAVFTCGSDGFCEDRARSLGLLRTGESFRWGNALIDVDADGDLDLFEATGHVYTEEEGASIGAALARMQPPNLYENVDSSGFARVIPEPGSGLMTRYHGRGIAVLDADDDGRLDVVVATTQGPPALLHNVREPVGHFLRMVLVGRAPNTGAVGARVILTTDAGLSLTRMRLAGEGYLGSFDSRLHFGVPSSGPVTLEVRWPSGTVTVHEVTDLDTEVVIREP